MELLLLRLLSASQIDGGKNPGQSVGVKSKRFARHFLLSGAGQIATTAIGCSSWRRLASRPGQQAVGLILR